MPEVVGHPLDAGLAGLAAAYDDGLDPVAVVDAVLDRIGASGDDAVWIDVEPAAVLRTEAERIAALARDGRPLWGVPFAVKDNIDVAGRTTTAGLPGLARRATATATAVARLQSAGAIYVGKTNLDQLATGLVGTRSPYGTPRNPIDPALVPGGSSSGSAVAVALGHVPLALGTDTAGSGRVPAAMCGVVGLKGAPGTRPVDGLVPASPTIDCVSTFAGTVADGLVAEGVLAGSPWPVASALTIAVAPGAGAEVPSWSGRGTGWSPSTWRPSTRWATCSTAVRGWPIGPRR
ncbi:MAG: amidase family protein [Acidimicrobiales bacterium]